VRARTNPRATIVDKTFLKCFVVNRLFSVPDYLDFYVSDLRFKTISLVKYQQYIECLVLQTIILRSKHVQGLALRFFLYFRS
jgi:hypothetical protein